jgi:1-acyl-sn-glycerol-3-phosphate acyltransferase
MFELMRLSGQEYVDEYAAVVKLRLAGKPADPAAAAEPLATPAPAEGTGTGFEADAGATPAGAAHLAPDPQKQQDDGGAAATA